MDLQNLSVSQYTERCKRIEVDYKHLHRQHLTVFGAFQRLQKAAKGLRTSAENVQHALYSTVDDKELDRMLDEQEQIMNKLRLIEKENEGLMGTVDPMTAEDYKEREYDASSYTTHIQTAGGTSKPNNQSATHPRLSRLPPYDGYHESHIAPYKKACGGVLIENSTYLQEIARWAPKWFSEHPFTSLYGYTNALVDYKHPLPKGKFTEAANHNPTLYYPFRRMLSEIVGNVRWCDYVFHHRIPGMFTIEEMEALSKLKADAYNPCLKVTVKGDDAVNTKTKWDTLFKADYEEHNHRTRVMFPRLSPEVRYFLPAYELEGYESSATLTLIFHVAQGNGKVCTLPTEGVSMDTLEYGVYTSHSFGTTDTMSNATVKELRKTEHQNRETFRMNAFSHCQSDIPQDNVEIMVNTCIEEFKILHNTLNRTWNNGYARLHSAVNGAPSTTPLTTLLEAMPAGAPMT